MRRIVYESMFGNTHVIADAIAKGLESLDNVVVVPVARQAANGWATPTCSWWAVPPIFTA